MNTEAYAPKFLSRQEAAKLLNVDLATIDRLVATGVLTRYRIQRRWVRVLAAEVAELDRFPRGWLRRC